MKKLQLIYPKLSTLVDNPVQPPVRTSGSALAGLLADMSDTDSCHPIAVVDLGGGRLCKADGHRRAACATKLGWAEIPAIVYEGDPVYWFIKLNRAVRSMKANEWFTMWAKCSVRKKIEREMHPEIRKSISACVDIWGLEDTIALGLRGDISPGVSSSVRILHTLFAQRPRTCAQLEQRVIGDWIIKHSFQRPAVEIRNHFANDSKLIAKLNKRIAQDRAFPKADWFTSEKRAAKELRSVSARKLKVV